MGGGSELQRGSGDEVCDDTDGRLTFRTTLSHRRGRRTVTQRRGYRPYSSPTFTDGDVGCDTYRVLIAFLNTTGAYTMRMTVTDARGGRSKTFVKRFFVSD
jgi:hypothetical protein